MGEGKAFEDVGDGRHFEHEEGVDYEAGYEHHFESGDGLGDALFVLRWEGCFQLVIAERHERTGDEKTVG